ncbi:MFS transporter [Streptomyces sp. NPDC048638]|uniref:MFS transporter n=1 Tax=Streptomyces sp. NPDC048638 TaxID=3365580 RepID=UPI003722FE95
MHTYRQLFIAPEFTALFLMSAAQVAAQTLSGLALGTLVHASTGSPLLSALAMFGPCLAQVVGAATLLSAADRLPPRATLTGLALLFGLGTAAQAVPGLPVAAVFAVLAGLGTAAALGGGVRYGLLNEILPAEGRLLGRAALNVSAGVVQVAGFALGGILVSALSARGALLTGAGLYLAAAATARCGLSRRPPRATGRPSPAETWRTNARLWASRPRRHVYLALWVPNGLIAGCESLYVSYAPRYAGLLFACGALGMLAGDTAVGRFVPARWRHRLVVPLCLLLAVPYLLFGLHPALPLAAAAVSLATVGYGAGLLLQERLLALTPPEASGHALGLHTSGMLTWQGVGAALAGAVAERTSAATGMAATAAASIAVTLALAPGLRPGPPQPRTHPATARAPRRHTGSASSREKRLGLGSGVTDRRAKPAPPSRRAKSSRVRSRPPTLTSMFRSLI